MNIMNKVSFADVLRIQKGIPKANPMMVAELCGYGYQQKAKHRESARVRDPSKKKTDFTASIPQDVPEDLECDDTQYDGLTFPLAIQATYHTKKDEEIIYKVGRTFSQDPIDDDDLDAQEAIVPDKIPLISWPRLWPYLKQALGQQQPGKKVDTKRVIEKASRLKPLSLLPRKSRLAWSPIVHILIDRRPELLLFRDEAKDLVDMVATIRGRAGLTCHYLPEGLPEGEGINLWSQRRVSLPNPGPMEPVLIIGDLGCLTRDERLMTSWMHYGSKLKRIGCSPCALMPCPRDRWYAPHAQVWYLAEWDCRGKLPKAGVHLGPVGEYHDPHGIVRALLRLLAPAIRIEPALLRRIRMMLDDRVDVGVEFDAWHHVHVTNDAEAMTIHPKFACELLHELAVKQDDTCDQLPDVLADYHADCSRLNMAIEVIRLVCAGINVSEQIVNQAVETLQKTNAKRLQLLEQQHKDPAVARDEAKRTGVFWWQDIELTQIPKIDMASEDEVTIGWTLKAH